MLNVKSDFLLDSVKEIISTSAVQNEHTILIVDDEINNLQLLKRTLRGKYHILTASNGLEALETLKENIDSVSLIVSDHKMPIMEGTKFLEEANTIAPDVIKILLTGFSDIEIDYQSGTKASRTPIATPFRQVLEKAASYVTKNTVKTGGFAEAVYKFIEL